MELFFDAFLELFLLDFFFPPTKVKQIENVVFTAKESKRLTATDVEIEDLMKELNQFEEESE